MSNPIQLPAEETLYQTKTGSPGTMRLAPGKRLVHVSDENGMKRVRITAQPAGVSKIFVELSNELMTAEIFENYILPSLESPNI